MEQWTGAHGSTLVPSPPQVLCTPVPPYCSPAYPCTRLTPVKAKHRPPVCCGCSWDRQRHGAGARALCYWSNWSQRDVPSKMWSRPCGTKVRWEREGVSPASSTLWAPGTDGRCRFGDALEQLPVSNIYEPCSPIRLTLTSFQRNGPFSFLLASGN